MESRAYAIRISVALLLLAVSTFAAAQGRYDEKSSQLENSVPTSERGQQEAEAGQDTAESEQRVDRSEMETIRVYAIKQSLAKALQEKRSADDIRDVITTADIGSFPDQNLAEAVQRLPGVAINRNKGEGRFVTIRGLPPELNRISWNGITMPSGQDDRSVPLDILSADLFGSISVVKSQSADQDSGKLGGSLNLATPAPLELPDNTLSLSAKGFYNSLAEEVGPAFSVLGAKQFMDNRLGVVAGITYSDRTIRQDSIESGGWNFVKDFFPTGDSETDNLLVWENGKPTLFEEERERVTALLGIEADLGTAGHYRFDAMYSSFNIDSERYQLLHRFKNADSIENIVSDGEKVVSADFINARLGLNERAFIDDTDSLLTSLRADWQPGPGWAIDAQLGALEIKNDWPLQQKYKYRPDGFNIGYDVSETFSPRFRYNNFSLEEILASPELFDEFDEVVLQPRDAEDTTLRAELNSRYQLETSALSAIQVGLQFQNREKERIQSKLKVGSNTQPLTDFLGDGVSIPGDDTFLSQLNGGFPWIGSILAPIENLQNGIIPPGGIPVPPNQLDSFSVEEDVVAGYLRADFDFGNGWSGNIGNRVVNTDFTAAGFENVNGTVGPVAFTEDYTQNLPSGTINYQLRNDLVIRGSGGRAMVKPQFADLAPRRSVNEDERTINQGNPDLDPFLATQGDLSIEWYFADEGVLAVAGLYKDIESFIFDQTRVENLPNPEAFGAAPALAGEQFSITQPLNGSGAEVWGFEFSWQQPFSAFSESLRGFGIQSNYTYLDSSANFSANLSGEDQAAGEGFSEQNFGLPGISDHVVNATLYYDLSPLTIRLAYNYRSEFLISPAGAEGQPEFIADFDQLDAFAAYDVTPNISVFVEGINLTNEPLRRFSNPGEKIELFSDNGFRLFGGVRAKF